MQFHNNYDVNTFYQKMCRHRAIDIPRLRLYEKLLVQTFSFFANSVIYILISR